MAGNWDRAWDWESGRANGDCVREQRTQTVMTVCSYDNRFG